MLWLFALLNYLYADVMTLMDPRGLANVLSGHVGSMQVNEWFLLGAAILMETAIAMVLFSRVLGYAVNRWANIIVGILHTVAVLASMFVGEPPALYYIFFAAIEVPTTLLIIWLALRWREDKV